VYFRDRASRRLDVFEAEGSGQIERRLVADNNLLDGLLDEAERGNAVAIVVGTSRWEGLRRLVMGDLGARLIRHARCPVIAAPQGYAALARARRKEVVA
jgi:nucleotide-binding universal stress UspA family protein